MIRVSFDEKVLEPMMERAAEVAIQRRDERRPRDVAGGILLTKREAAKLMGVSEKTIDRWRDKHGLPCFRVGSGKPMYRPETLRNWVAEHETSLANGG